MTGSFDPGVETLAPAVLRDRQWARLATLPPGQIMKLTARDPGAPADIPAWCRMTGHTLMTETHPVYLIRRKES